MRCDETRTSEWKSLEDGKWRTFRPCQPGEVGEGKRHWFPVSAQDLDELDCFLSIRHLCHSHVWFPVFSFELRKKRSDWAIKVLQPFRWFGRGNEMDASTTLVSKVFKFLQTNVKRWMSGYSVEEQKSSFSEFAHFVRVQKRIDQVEVCHPAFKLFVVLLANGLNDIVCFPMF